MYQAKIVQGHFRAAAVEMHLAAQQRRERGRAERRIEGRLRLRRVAAGEPGIAGLNPEVRRGGVAHRLGVAGGLLERRRRVRPALELRISEPEALARMKPATLALPVAREGDRPIRRRAHQVCALAVDGFDGIGGGRSLDGGSGNQKQ
jgi:hypothetical protein